MATQRFCPRELAWCNYAVVRAALVGFLLTASACSAAGEIIESVTEDIATARGREFAKSKGGPENNTLTNTNNPVRAGKAAFKHWVNTKGERSELAMQRTKIGGTYWYGWSTMLPADFDHRGSDTIVMQLASWPTPRNGKFPHSANGPYLEIQPDGRMIMHLQHKGQGTDMVCDDFIVADDVSKLRGKWLDFVMNAKWTGDDDGQFKLWLKVDDNNYLQKVDYAGPTWWNDEDTGPYFKMGAYMGEPGWKGPASRTVYTDEYRLSDEDSSFDEVAPGASERHEDARRGKLQYRLYRSDLNDQDIPILVYMPPGYNDSTERRFPVVYNLHGAGGGSPERQWDRVRETLVDAMENERVPPMIYVFVNGLGDTFFIDYADRSLQVESSIIRELIPFIDANYRTIASSDARAIDGFSMGGAGALTLAMKYPGVFSSVASYGAALITAERGLSPGGAHRWADENHFHEFSAWGAVERNAHAIREKLRVRIVCGEEDGLLQYNVRFKEMLDRLHIDYEWIPVPGVGHDTRRLYRQAGLASLTFFAAGLARSHAAPAFPLKPSADGRYLVDAAGAPFFVHADTAWQAPKRLTLSEFEEYLLHRAKLGFNTVFLHTFSREVSPDNNRNGDRPFDPPNDISAPNEPYWRHLDKVLALAEEKGFFVAIAPLWIRWGGNDIAGWRAHFAEKHAEGYGKFLGTRYADRKNIMWIVGGDANPQEKAKAIDLLARGIKQSAPHHLITVHNRPEFSSASYFDAVPWLDVNLAYSYRETYIHVGGEWNRLGKRRPILLGESGYEEESNDGRGGSTHRVRRQAYGAILSGALTGHAFGNKHIWRCDDEWRKALDSPGSQQMAHIQGLFTSIPWYKLIPDDQYHPLPPEFAESADAVRSKQLITAGRGLYGVDDYMPAAVAEDGSFALVYLPIGRPITVNTSRLAGKPQASWYDPADGSRQAIKDINTAEQYQEFLPPKKNAAGDTDWVLVLEAPHRTEQRENPESSP